MGQDELCGSGPCQASVYTHPQVFIVGEHLSLRIYSLLDNLCQEGAVGEVGHPTRLIDQNDYSVFDVWTKVQALLDEF